MPAVLEPITISSAERTLYGILELPAGIPDGGVVLVHGWGGCRVGPHRILTEAARRLNDAGLAALRFDLGGRGESTGDPLTTDLDAMIDDAGAAVDELKGRLGAGAPLGLLGMCSGGNVALAAAALRCDVAAVVAWSTYPFQEQRAGGQDLKRTGYFARRYLAKALRPSTWIRLLRGRVDLGGVGRTMFGHYEKGEGSAPDLQRSRREILGPLASYRGGIFFLYGGRDPEAPDAERVFREFCDANGASAHFETIAGANHNFYSLDWKRRAIELSAEWLAGALRG